MGEPEIEPLIRVSQWFLFFGFYFIQRWTMILMAKMTFGQGVLYQKQKKKLG